MNVLAELVTRVLLNSRPAENIAGCLVVWKQRLESGDGSTGAKKAV